MTIAQAAYVLDRTEDHVERAIKSSRLESRADEGRGTTSRRRHITITRESLLVYIIRYTTGGDRLTLMLAIEQLLPPAMLQLARHVVTPPPPLPPQALEASTTSMPKRRGNIIPHPALKNHPEFPFTASLQAQQSA